MTRYRVTVLSPSSLHTVEARDPFHAEKKARAERPELKDKPLAVVADSQVWKREPWSWVSK